MDVQEVTPQEFAAILYAEPGALGLIANIMAALIVAVENMLEGPFTPQALFMAGAHLIVIGGVLQLIAAVLSWRRNDHLVGTAFMVFASLWTIHGTTHILNAFLDAQAVRTGILPGMIGFMAVAVTLCVCAVLVNFIMPPVLVALMLTLIFEGVGAFFPWGRRVAAAFELFIVLSSMYAVVVMTTKGVSQRYILPGFGNAPFDPLLIRATAQDSRKNEKKKDTKYGEPMGMGYMGNVVPAAVLLFHHLGFFQDFRPAMPFFLYTFLCQVMASYYAFLRHDFFHSLQFMLYFVFWMSRGLTQLLITTNFPAINNLRVNFYGQWGLIGLLLVLCAVSLCRNKVVFFYNALFTVMAILSVDHIPVAVHNFTFGVSAAVVALASLYIAMAHLANSIAEKPIMHVGLETISPDRLGAFFDRIFARFRDEKPKGLDYANEDTIHEKIVDVLTFASSTVALACLSPLEATQSSLSLPWVTVAGVFMHLYTARLAFAAGSLAKAYMLTVLAAFWTVWAVSLFNPNLVFALRAASVGVLCLHTVALLMTPAFSRVWMPFALLMELCVIALVVRCFNTNPPFMVLVTSVLAVVVSFYAALAEMVNNEVQDYIVPTGEPPLLKEMEQGVVEEPPCPLFPSRRSSALRRAAAVLDSGGVLGTPTDTVYALGASCKHPESIRRIYHIKGRPPEKPICLCLSRLEQLAEAKPDFSPLLWTFMRKVYPGGVSCVLPKGAWLQNLGLGDAVDYVGTPESICIRVPDSSVLAYLVSLAGPIAITSGNPSGGADSIHHSMLINSLGDKLDGVVCDGESNELVASTVVNCLKIDEGEISYFRVGCTPKERVDQLFEEAKAEVRSQHTKLDVADLISPAKS